MMVRSIMLRRNMLKLAERRLVDSRKLSRIFGRLERKM